MGSSAVEGHHGDAELVEQVEAHVHSARAFGRAVAEHERGFDHRLHRLDRLLADHAADERLRALTHHRGAWFDRVDAHAGAIQLDRESVRDRLSADFVAP